MRFYLNRSGQSEGPLEEAQIVAMIQRGEVPPTAYVCPEGGQAWQPLSSHPPFAAGAAPAPPAAPQKPIAATVAMSSAMFQEAARAAASQPGFSSAQTPAPQSFAQPQSFGAPQSVGAPQAPAPAKPKSKLGLIIGGGCGLLLVLGACLGGGIGVYLAYFSSSDFADTVNGAANDMLASADARQADIGGTWVNSGGAGSTVYEANPEAQTELARIGADPEIVLTGIELRAISGTQAVRTIAIVFPDGEVRYSGFRARESLEPAPRSFPRYFDAQRHLGEAVDAFLDRAADDCDSIELLGSEQIEELPADLRQDILRDTAATDRQTICDTVTRLGRSTFTITQVPELTTIVRQDGRYGLISSQLSSPDSNPNLVYLTPVRVRMIEAPSAEPAQPAELPVTNSAMDPRTVEPCVTECGGAQNTGCWQPCLDRRAAEINARVAGQP